AAAAIAVAETPNVSSSALMRSDSSRTEMLFSSSIQSSVVTFVAIFSPPYQSLLRPRRASPTFHPKLLPVPHPRPDHPEPSPRPEPPQRQAPRPQRQAPRPQRQAPRP